MSALSEAGQGNPRSKKVSILLQTSVQKIVQDIWGGCPGRQSWMSALGVSVVCQPWVSALGVSHVRQP
jgi:hypothetical protein